MYLMTGPEWYTKEASVQLQGLLDKLLLLIAVHLAKASGCGGAGGTASIRNERRNLRMSASSVRSSATHCDCFGSTQAGIQRSSSFNADMCTLLAVQVCSSSTLVHS